MTERKPNMPVNGNNSSGDNGNVTVQDVSLNQSYDTPEINSVRVRLSAFWNTNPTIWFIQAEINRLSRLGTKYCLTVASLPPNTCKYVIDILALPPSSNKYEVLKTADIGDKKPSEVFISTKMLSGRNFNGEIVKNL